MLFAIAAYELDQRLGSSAKGEPTHLSWGAELSRALAICLLFLQNQRGKQELRFSTLKRDDEEHTSYENQLDFRIPLVGRTRMRYALPPENLYLRPGREIGK